MWLVVVVQWCGGAVAKSLDSTKRTRVRILCCCVKPWASLFTLHCSSSLSRINENLAVDISGYLCTSFIIQVCKGVKKCKAL